MSPTNEIATPLLNRVQWIALVIGVLGLVILLAGAWIGPASFFQAYLFAFVFWLGMTLGCLALAMLHQLSGGMWGAVVIRFLEAGMSTTPLMFALFIPVAIGLFFLYPWTNPATMANDPVLQHQVAYLNVPFYLIRAVVYFVVWLVLAYFLRRRSLERDRNPDPALTVGLQYLAALGLVVFGLTGTFAVIDWVMSLEPHWYSTVYAAMVLMGGVLGSFAFVIVVVALLEMRAPLARVTGSGLFNDLGSLLLAFVMLWAYLGFSQFLLIYAGNLTQETPWYVHRLQGGWEWIALAVALFEFLIPFLLLVFRDLKRNPRLLAPVASLLVLARLVDVFWLIKPAFSPDQLNVSWMDFVAPVAIGGLWISLFAWQLKRHPLLPQHDRHLIEKAEGELVHERP